MEMIMLTPHYKGKLAYKMTFHDCVVNLNDSLVIIEVDLIDLIDL